MMAFFKEGKIMKNLFLASVAFFALISISAAQHHYPQQPQQHHYPHHHHFGFGLSMGQQSRPYYYAPSPYYVQPIYPQPQPIYPQPQPIYPQPIYPVYPQSGVSLYFRW